MTRAFARAGTSRLLGPVKQCSVYVRGNLRCAWCVRFLASRDEATVDHLDGEHRNNKPWNLVPACRDCNFQRSLDWTRGQYWGPDIAVGADRFFSVYLARRGAILDEAIDRVEAQRWRPLPRSCGSLLARRWHPERMEFLRRRDMLRRDRMAPGKQAARIERLAIQSGASAGEVEFP